MTHQHSAATRPRRFRVFVTNQYYANRDEYFAHGQQQPYTFDEYVTQHLSLLKQQYKQHLRHSAASRP